MARLKTDWILFLTILAMVALRPGDGLQRVERRRRASLSRRAVLLRRCARFGWAVVSFVVLMYFKRMDYRRLNTPAWAFSGLGIVLGLLVLVYFVDSQRTAGSSSPGVGSFQPSEFAKPALILFLAYFIARRAHVINDRRTLQQAFVAVRCWRSWWWWPTSAPRWCP